MFTLCVGMGVWVGLCLFMLCLSMRPYNYYLDLHVNFYNRFADKEHS